MLLLNDVDESSMLCLLVGSPVSEWHIYVQDIGLPSEEMEDGEADRTGWISRKNQPFLAATVAGDKRPKNRDQRPGRRMQVELEALRGCSWPGLLYKCRLEMEAVECSRSTDLVVHFREVDSSGREKYLDLLGGSPATSTGIS